MKRIKRPEFACIRPLRRRRHLQYRLVRSTWKTKKVRVYFGLNQEMSELRRTERVSAAVLKKMSWALTRFDKFCRGSGYQRGH
jgi:hypothetical protein